MKDFNPLEGLAPAQAAFRGQIIAACILGAAIIYPILGVVMVKIGFQQSAVSPDVLPVLKIVMCFVVIVTAIASVPLRKVVLARMPGGDTDIGNRMCAVMIALVIAETAGVLGFVYALLSGSLGLPFVLWGISLAAGIMNFPTRSWLETGN
jgi:hypothetical protein